MVSIDEALTVAEGEVNVAIVYAPGSRGGALEICQGLIAKDFHCLLLIREIDPQLVFQAIEIGVHSIDQSSLPQAYVKARLDSIIRRRQMIGPQVVTALMEEIQRRGQRAFLTRGLSTREVEVVELVGLGLSNGEIGARLGITTSAVNRMVTGIRHTLELSSRDDLIRRAHEMWRSPR
ncbi:response regulator transcription factor [Gordonia sp. PDNC005]|uniref:helix-turn-helix transcriptional regulator n=1 Tax=unclassified Gordonia (in: high G+C Gram-positive bacteria) TaxID=2657482 RepID=UPI001963276C|nr:LuxR C-terminal-related transcriptional regulator [Gordonia sp. PDNC005]QRY62382.1 response regulator transcription factor [Gordonia sp. PDNC005]